MSEGWQPCEQQCPKCRKQGVLVRLVEDDAGHEDYQYRCQNPKCGHTWWTEGSDY